MTEETVTPEELVKLLIAPDARPFQINDRGQYRLAAVTPDGVGFTCFVRLTPYPDLPIFPDDLCDPPRPLR